MSIPVRLKKFRNSLTLTQTEFGERIGKKLRTIQDYEAGRNNVDLGTVKLMSYEFGLNPEWLKTGTGGMFIEDETKAKYDMVPIYDVAASAGYGAWVSGEAILGYYPMPENLITKEFKVKPQNINFLHIKGDSMSPILQDGDLVAIDRSRTEATKGLYVCRIENDLYIKNVSFQKDTVILTSENPAYEPILAQYAEFELIGAVVWFGRALKWI